MKRTKLIKIFILFLLTIIYCNAIFAGYYDDIDWVSKSYEDGEPMIIIHRLNQKELTIVIL